MEKELEINNRKLTPGEQENLRKNVIRVAKKNLMPNGSVRNTKVAEICGCSPSHVRQTWAKYKNGGVNAIKAVKMGRPKGNTKLTPKQEKEIVKKITDNDPNQLKLPGCLWDRKLVAGLIKQLYKIEMPLSTMGDYLAKWGFTAQRPKKKHYKQDEAEVKTWLEEEYPEISRSAKAANAEIHWVDETGVHNTSNYVKGYSPKGVTPVLEVAGVHIRVNMISSVTNQGKLRFKFYRGKMNQERYIDFLERLIKTSSRMVYAIADNLSVHHGLRVREWAEKNSDKIKLFYLPKYSPHLNPDEYLNNNLKQKMAKMGYSENADEVQQKATSAMRSIQNTKGRVASFFEHDDTK